MPLYGSSAILGLDIRSIDLFTFRCSSDALSFYPVDASPGSANATTFNDSLTSGLGGWGDPTDDYQVTTGAFAENFEVVYPVPHGSTEELKSKPGTPP